MRDDDVERRLTELEIKASLQEDLLDRLNEVVVSQQTRIDALARELARLARERRADDDASAAGPRDEVPPHY